MREDDIESRGGQKRGDNGRSNHSSSSTVEDMGIHWTSWLVPMFVVANVAVFVFVMYINNCPDHPPQGFVGGGGHCVARFLGRFSFQPLRENPLFGPSASTALRVEVHPDLCQADFLLLLDEQLKKLGALDWNKVVNKHQGWRLVTSIWLHAGVVHLLVNMLSLAFIGIRLEQQFGFVRIGVLYLLSGFGGSVLSTLFIRNYISVGASGALFGLLGAMLSELITNWSMYRHRAAALLTLIFIIAVNLVIGILPHVDNFAHIGGFLTGFLLGFVLLPRPQFWWLERQNLPAGSRLESKYKPYQYVLWLVALVLLVVGLSMGLLMLFRGENGNDRCHWCHYLSCVPTSGWTCDGEQNV